jgi:hypothetical protein
MTRQTGDEAEAGRCLINLTENLAIARAQRRAPATAHSAAPIGGTAHVRLICFITQCEVLYRTLLNASNPARRVGYDGAAEFGLSRQALSGSRCTSTREPDPDVTRRRPAVTSRRQIAFPGADARRSNQPWHAWPACGRQAQTARIRRGYDVPVRRRRDVRTVLPPALVKLGQ